MSNSYLARKLSLEQNMNLQFEIQIQDLKENINKEKLRTDALTNANADLRAQLLQRMQQNNEDTSGVIDTAQLPRVEELQGLAEDRYNIENQQLEKQVEELLTHLANLPEEQRAIFNGVGDRLSNSVERDRQNVGLLRTHWEARARIHRQRALNAQRELDVSAVDAYRLASDGDYHLSDVRRMCAAVYAQVDTARARLADAVGRIAPPSIDPPYIQPENRATQPFEYLINAVDGEVDRLVELIGIAEAAKRNSAAAKGSEASDAVIARLQKEVTAERLRATSLAAQLESARTGPLSDKDCNRGERLAHANLVMQESDGRYDWRCLTAALGFEAGTNLQTAVAAVEKLQDVSQASQNRAGTQQNAHTGNTSPWGRRSSAENVEVPQIMDDEDETDVELMLDQVVSLIGAEIPGSSSSTVEELVQEFIDEFAECRAYGQRMADIQRSLENNASALLVENGVILNYYARDINAIRTSFGDVERNYQLMVNQSRGSSLEFFQPAALDRATQKVDAQIKDSLTWITEREEIRRGQGAELERIRTQIGQYPPSANSIDTGSLEVQLNAPQNLLTEVQRAQSLANNAQLAADAVRVAREAEREAALTAQHQADADRAAASAAQRREERRQRRALANSSSSQSAGDINNKFENIVNINNYENDEDGEDECPMESPEPGFDEEEVTNGADSDLEEEYRFPPSSNELNDPRNNNSTKTALGNNANNTEITGGDVDYPVNDAPTDDEGLIPPNDDAPIDDAPIDDAPIDDAPIDDAPVDYDDPYTPPENATDDNNGDRIAPANDTSAQDGNGDPPAKDPRAKDRKGAAFFTTDSDYDSSTNDPSDDDEDQPGAFTCNGITAKNTKCKHTVKTMGGYCFQHIKQDPRGNKGKGKGKTQAKSQRKNNKKDENSPTPEKSDDICSWPSKKEKCKWPRQEGSIYCSFHSTMSPGTQSGTAIQGETATPTRTTRAATQTETATNLEPAIKDEPDSPEAAAPARTFERRPRCTHISEDGARCPDRARRGRKYCSAHQIQERRNSSPKLTGR